MIPNWPSVTQTVTKAQLLEIARKRVINLKQALEYEQQAYAQKLEDWKAKQYKRIEQAKLNIEAGLPLFNNANGSSYWSDASYDYPPHKPYDYEADDLQKRIQTLELLPDGPVHYLLREALQMSYDSSSPRSAGYRDPNGPMFDSVTATEEQLREAARTMLSKEK